MRERRLAWDLRGERSFLKMTAPVYGALSVLSVEVLGRGSGAFEQPWGELFLSHLPDEGAEGQVLRSFLPSFICWTPCSSDALLGAHWGLHCAHGRDSCKDDKGMMVFSVSGSPSYPPPDFTQ